MTSAFQTKYNSLAHTLGVTEDEEPISKFMFFAGIKYALKQATNVVPRVEASLVFPTLTANKKVQTSNTYGTFNNVGLTTSEAQSLKDHLAHVLTDIQSYEKQLDELAKKLYTAADKNSVIGEYAFKTLNSVRNTQRKTKSTKVRLQGIQKKLKSISRQG